MPTDSDKFADLRQIWPAPSRPRPIVLIGCGGIANDAHLPAYRKANFPVAAVFDADPARAQATAAKWGIPRVLASLAEAAGQRGVVFDVAVPPEFELGIVEALPRGAAVLLQKPMGVDLADARRVRQVCRERSLTAAVNLQLRFAPMMLAVRDALDRGLFGPIRELEFHVQTRTPWELFPFLKNLKRAEILVHTIHHLDFCRHMLGEPRGVYARTIGHPRFPGLASTRTAIILDYGDATRCVLSINHNYEFGPEHECADVRVQGRDGAAQVSLGLLLSYPQGKPELLRMVTRGSKWVDVPVQGKWFPDAFIGTMSNLQRFAAGEDDRLVSSCEDAYRTMALVEACYTSDATGATPIPE